jgi:hypothetical protein
MAHAEHVAPAVPQEPLPSLPYGSHVPAAVQHPFGHEAALQTHCPPLQACPDGHAPPVVPHSQVPLTQVSALMPHVPQAAPFCPQWVVFCDP